MIYSEPTLWNTISSACVKKKGYAPEHMTIVRITAKENCAHIFCEIFLQRGLLPKRLS